jgi:ketosteroid isomerase-like protein
MGYGGLTPDDVAGIEREADAYVIAMKARDWQLVAQQTFAEHATRIPPHEEPHRGRDAIQAWLGGIAELITYDLARDVLDGANGFAYARGRYTIELRPQGAPAPIADHGDFLEIWRKEPDGAYSGAQVGKPTEDVRDLDGIEKERQTCGHVLQRTAALPLSRGPTSQTRPALHSTSGHPPAAS